MDPVVRGRSARDRGGTALSKIDLAVDACPVINVRAANRPPRTVGERRALLDSLDDPVGWPTAAADLLAELGFRLLAAVGPEEDSHLLVALRAMPTLRHFDPELVAYYAPAANGAALVSVDRSVAQLGTGHSSTRALWGHVHVIDRLEVENRFLTFGGELRLAVIDDSLTVMDLCSPAPIVRWGGHSQATDGVAAGIGAFFGRLIVPVDFVPGAAVRIDAVLPEVLYRAFLIDGIRRSAPVARRGTEPTALDDWLTTAWARARADPAACAAAMALLAYLGIAPANAMPNGPAARAERTA